MERFSESIEAEIAELNAQIAEKRKLLESKSGVVHENAAESSGDSKRELVLAVLKENVQPTIASVVPAATASPQGTSVSYLDSLDEETSTRVNSLITLAFSKGINPALRAAQNESPAVMDAFHDALADRLLSELKTRNLIS